MDVATKVHHQTCTTRPKEAVHHRTLDMILELNRGALVVLREGVRGRRGVVVVSARRTAVIGGG